MTFMKPLISPSMLSADFLHLAKEVAMVNRSVADFFHLDIMDGLFVPNLSFGLPVVKAIHQMAEKPLDVHLMIEKPERYITHFKEAGAGILTVHWESATHLHRTVYQIKSEDMLAGVALNPHTPVSVLEDMIADVDLVLIMSVNPGFGGQKFIERSLHRIAELREMIERRNATALIEIDGGIGLDNAADIVKAGVDILVAGNSVFKTQDPLATIEQLKNIVEE
jgi:ribulose-phosphate 3-epimerase